MTHAHTQHAFTLTQDHKPMMLVTKQLVTLKQNMRLPVRDYSSFEKYKYW